jgi:hypothetical protein
MGSSDGKFLRETFFSHFPTFPPMEHRGKREKGKADGLVGKQGRENMSASQRRKGAAAEREVLKLLGAELGVLLQRNIQQTRDGGADCLCVKGWAIEVKRQEALSRPKWWRQAVEQASRLGVQPMLLYRRSREPWKAWISPGVDMTLQEAACAIREKLLGWP